MTTPPHDVDGGYLTDAEWAALDDHIKFVWHERIAEAVAAERERCARHPHLLRAISDPGSVVPRDKVPTVNGTELESLPHWQMRAVAALLREAQP